MEARGEDREVTLETGSQECGGRAPLLHAVQRPSGVGAGLDPPRFLRPGDLIEIEVTGCGRLVNPMA